ncbi:class I tRNA ligase family protein, partial [Salmonella sp. SAL4431]|uniref:class I tRNA ligase family protein n=1 Tax=Salmonella sp. SAL4431 TaxID=3159886 RepID=UPI00397E27C7
TNAFTALGAHPKAAMETLVLLLSPLAPHVAEELWQAIGQSESLAYEPWPSYDPELLHDEQIIVPVQINGKVRGRIVVQ